MHTNLQCEVTSSNHSIVMSMLTPQASSITQFELTCPLDSVYYIEVQSWIPPKMLDDAACRSILSQVFSCPRVGGLSEYLIFSKHIFLLCPCRSLLLPCLVACVHYGFTYLLFTSLYTFFIIYSILFYKCYPTSVRRLIACYNDGFLYDWSKNTFEFYM